MKYKAYAPGDFVAIQARRDKGHEWPDIAKDFSKSVKGIQQWYYKQRRLSKSTKPKGKKRGPKVKDFMPSAPLVIATKRPMVAFIGEHTEIVAAIRELFSE